MPIRNIVADPVFNWSRVKNIENDKRWRKGAKDKTKFCDTVPLVFAACWLSWCTLVKIFDLREHITDIIIFSVRLRLPDSEKERLMSEKSFPKTVGGCADRLYTLREKRRELDRQVNAIKSEFEALKAHYFKLLAKQRLESARGRLAQGTVVHKSRHRPGDWQKIYAFIEQTGDHSLLQRRLSEETVRAYFDDGQPVPGVEVEEYVDLSLTKVK